MHSFTTEDLLQFVYNESSIQKTAAIKIAIESDWILREKYEEIIAAKQCLGKAMYSPRKQAIDSILAYAEKSVKRATSAV